MNSKKFVRELTGYTGTSVFNPYSDICKVFDKRNANLIRLKNLELILGELSSKEVDAIWIGRDLGHRGGRRTGLALTDEGSLEIASELWGVELTQATKGQVFYERTAANIWSSRQFINSNIFMWNVFPFHPHKSENPFTNRSHTARERDSGLSILEALLTILRPQKIVAIGNDAYKCSLKVHDQDKVFKVRHPSYGGEREFSSQISQLYGMSRSQQSLF